MHGGRLLIACNDKGGAAFLLQLLRHSAEPLVRRSGKRNCRT
jgi:hypothetical protein